MLPRRERVAGPVSRGSRVARYGSNGAHPSPLAQHGTGEPREAHEYPARRARVVSNGAQGLL
ncbi:hypothetical protein SEA_BRAXOADDIE_82 [Rhodococcus phage Braxoaddie]|nr:hypothetical protein SEA_BRAXOADDIE_82 [Rhodococcus phage Braxoaddie]